MPHPAHSGVGSRALGRPFFFSFSSSGTRASCRPPTCRCRRRFGCDVTGDGRRGGGDGARGGVRDEMGRVWRDAGGTGRARGRVAPPRPRRPARARTIAHGAAGAGGASTRGCRRRGSATMAALPLPPLLVVAHPPTSAVAPRPRLPPRQRRLPPWAGAGAHAAAAPAATPHVLRVGNRRRGWQTYPWRRLSPAGVVWNLAGRGE